MRSYEVLNKQQKIIKKLQRNIGISLILNTMKCIIKLWKNRYCFCDFETKGEEYENLFCF